MSRVVVRQVRGRQEFVQAQEVARAAWEFDDLRLPAVADLQLVGHVGGLTAGAFDGKDMLGFVHGLPRTNLREPCHHSHMLAVIPEARGRSLASRLKFFQRRWCLARRIGLITWTYDPLLVRNAHLNLVRLKARARFYLPNFYGTMEGIYGRIPTDRFEVYWPLNDPGVRAAARRKPRELEGTDSLPRAGLGRFPSSRRLTVEIPANALELYAADPPRALRERLKLRRLAGRLFAKGYEAMSVKVLPASALYVFEKP